MNNLTRIAAVIIAMALTSNTFAGEHDRKETESLPTGSSALDQTLEWYRDAKFGMFIHWGLYSLDGIHCWSRYNARIPDDEYRALTKRFNPTEFDADAWVQAAKSAGMKWITITAKHHDGFVIYDSQVDEFDIEMTPFGQNSPEDAFIFARDPLKELADACKKHGIKLGFYYSHYQDWDHRGGGRAKITYAQKEKLPFREYMDEKALPQIKELLTNYGDAVVIWFDTPMHLSASEADEMRDLVRQTSPGTLICGRLDDARGDFWSIPDNRVPDNPFGELWETAMTAKKDGHAWGWTLPPKDVRPAKEMIKHLCNVVSRGGNYLLNTGPSPTGMLDEEDLVEFKKVGEWLKINGDAIYGTRQNPYFDSPYTCTTKENKIFYHLLTWPKDKSFVIERLESSVKKVYLLADPYKKPLKHTKEGDVLKVMLPKTGPDRINSILVVETEGVPVVQNPLLPTEDSDGTINIPASKITILNPPFSSLSDDRSVIGVKDSKRAWLNGAFEVKSPGKYDIYINYAAGDSSHNDSFWIKINDEYFDVPIDFSRKSGGGKPQKIGRTEFKTEGVNYFTIKPTVWIKGKSEIPLIEIEDVRLVKVDD